MTVDRERVRGRIEELASGSDRPDEVRNRYLQTQDLLAGIENEVMEDQVAEWLASKATVTAVPTTFRSLKDR
jgi:trigger factor